ncbi:hypothetical protein G3M48_005590 [Beauveria asiatica]|uniref:Uncharacterized protein n=1 Tax=Beauveria asiatica TaxID=1069075 RepID=A0AAW0RR02_9HYPO
MAGEPANHPIAGPLAVSISSQPTPQNSPKISLPINQAGFDEWSSQHSEVGHDKEQRTRYPTRRTSDDASQGRIPGAASSGRSGYLTCRNRKFKSDEAKPACSRRSAASAAGGSNLAYAVLH